MDQIHPLASGEGRDLGRRLERRLLVRRQPIQRQFGLDQLQSGNRPRPLDLTVAGRWPEQGENGRDPARSQGLGQYQRIGEDAPDRIGRQQDPHAAASDRSSSGNGSGRSSWMSLKRSYSAR